MPPRGVPPERIARTGAAASGPRVLERPRRIRRSGARVRDDPRRGTVDAGAVGQRGRQSRLRLPDVGRGRRLHVVRQQSREPAHGLVERSRRRPSGRSAVRARRRRRRTSRSDGSPDARRSRTLRRTIRPGLQPLRARRARTLARAAPVRPARRPDQDLAIEDPERLGPVSTSLGHRLRRVGARPIAWRVGARSSRPRSIRTPARCSRAIRGGRASASVLRSPTSPDASSRGLAIGASSSAAMALSSNRPHCCATSRSRVGSAPGSIRAARSRLG